ncbi:hypothetical protein FMM75_21210 [Lachnospiraceae bacterium MD335]|jgi:flagellum-specific peptidoglycan hydrolase FlgJ|nr:hypothetical protein [Lachnospiraceae bacterium MD335]
MDKKYDKYLEGNYDNANKEKQEKADKLQAERIGKLVDNMQKKQTEDLINSVLGDEELPIGDEEAVRELLHEYVSNKDEYLVDGAVLTCSMASTGTYSIGNVGLGTEIKNIDNPTQTLLRVSSNLSKITGMPVATVKDHKKQMNTGNIEQEETGNIEPFKCNCLSFPDRESEREAILNDEECRKYGICRQLMKLDNDWENFIKSTGYLSFNRTTEKERAQGITMKSVLFCSHGGLITPVTSGQYYNDVRYQKLLAETERRKGSLEEYKIEFVLKIFPKVLLDERISGIPAEITFAQMCLESAYGKKTCIDINTGINGNNYFGIKGIGPAGSVTCETKEEIAGKMVAVIDDFRAYNSMDESIEDHSNLLVNTYQQYIVTGSVEDWCNALKKGGYATASNYKEEILSVCKTWDIIE